MPDNLVVAPFVALGNILQVPEVPQVVHILDH